LAIALGSAPITSPSPPVLDQGAISDATNTKFVQLSPHSGGSSIAGGTAAAIDAASPPAAGATVAGVGSGAVHVGGTAPTCMFLRITNPTEVRL